MGYLRKCQLPTVPEHLLEKPSKGDEVCARQEANTREANLPAEGRAAAPPRPPPGGSTRPRPERHGHGAELRTAPAPLPSPAGRTRPPAVRSRENAKSPRPRCPPGGEKPGWAHGKTGTPPPLSTAQTAGDHPTPDTGGAPGARSSPHSELTRTAAAQPAPRRLRGALCCQGPAQLTDRPPATPPPPLRQWAPPPPVANARDGRAGSGGGGAEPPGPAPRPAPRVVAGGAGRSGP
ncbi:proline-rich protein 2-like [Passer domesticus]|uniref:proline-rich protein 2-like n=1 Tax=Passer domesticus TaxID=48849 RepID=UPI0030FECB05